MSISSRVMNSIIPAGKKCGPSLDTMLAQFDKGLENFDTLIEPVPESKPRTPFDSLDKTVDASAKFKNMKPKQALLLLPIMRSLMLNMRQGAKLYDGKFTPVPYYLIRHC